MPGKKLPMGVLIEDIVTTQVRSLFNVLSVLIGDMLANLQECPF